MKFRAKATCCMIILMALFFGAGGSALVSIPFHTSLRQAKAAAHTSDRMILNTLQIVNNMEEWDDEKDLSKILEQLSSQDAFSAALQLHSQNETLYSKGTAAAYLKDLSGQTDSSHLACTVISAPESGYYLQLSGSFFVGKEIYYLDAAYDITSIYETRSQQQELYQQIFIVLVCACACLSYILAYFLTRPLARLSKASREIACGNYDYRSQIRSNDEIGAVSRDFDLMADHLQGSIEQLQLSMERQNQFIGNFTHELKTPMTSIIGYADLLRSQTLSREDELDAAKYIFSEGKRLEHLSLKLLDIFVSQNESFSLAKASPAETITDLVTHLKPVLAREEISLVCTCEDGYCMLDPDFFGSLLVNLIENARKALAGREDKGRISVSCTMTEDGCQVKVADNGQGMPQAALSHITEAFYRVDKARARAQGGAGLGLTLCAEIARLHNGTIAFQSEEGQGTIVTVNLKGGRA